MPLLCQPAVSTPKSTPWTSPTGNTHLCDMSTDVTAKTILFLLLETLSIHELVVAFLFNDDARISLFFK
jgi:hypothetical protein